ncbi:MAG: hypothetical protein J5945_03715 [Candidatus Methanomethylophilus sp.]|nr:hypothetical protein [Methanomethylophilus sp.]
MIYTGEMILDTYSFTETAVSNPRMRLSRDVKEGRFLRLKRDLFESGGDTPREALAQAIYGPSYISFDYALAYHGMIPEHPFNVTCATFNKHRDKVFDTELCSFRYTDVPPAVFPEEVACVSYRGYSYNMATKEKALCDKLYKSPVAVTKKAFEDLVFDDLRIDEDMLFGLDTDTIGKLSPLYRCRNVTMLERYLRGSA